jgi:hypothetical protein
VPTCLLSSRSASSAALFRMRLHSVGEGYFHGRGDPCSPGNVGFDLVAEGLRPAFLTQKLAGEGVIFAENSEQQMFGLDGHASVLAGFVACEENRAAGFLCVAFKHTPSHISGGWPVQLVRSLRFGSELRKENTTRESVPGSQELWLRVPKSAAVSCSNRINKIVK